MHDVTVHLVIRVRKWGDGISVTVGHIRPDKSAKEEALRSKKRPHQYLAVVYSGGSRVLPFPTPVACLHGCRRSVIDRKR